MAGMKLAAGNHPILLKNYPEQCVRVEWAGGKMQEVAGSEFIIPADLILLAMGFVGPVKAGLLEQVGVALSPRGNVAADTEAYATSEPGVFACGDMRRGQSLVVWAIREGRESVPWQPRSAKAEL